MNPIASYAFGRMAVNDQIFTSDLIIFPDGRIQPHPGTPNQSPADFCLLSPYLLTCKATA